MEVIVHFRGKMPGGFSAYIHRVGTKKEAYRLMKKCLSDDYVACKILSTNSCLYVKQKCVKAVEIRL